LLFTHYSVGKVLCQVSLAFLVSQLWR
jgi:hypothetical protein